MGAKRWHPADRCYPETRMVLPEIPAGPQSHESPMSESIRAQWKNLPTSFLPAQQDDNRRNAPQGGVLEPIDHLDEVHDMVDHEADDKQSVCIQTLVAGNCKAYIELFYLTHMANAEVEETTVDSEARQDEETGPRKVTTDSVAN